MLKQRVITALVLLAILLPALFHANPLPFTARAMRSQPRSASVW